MCIGIAVIDCLIGRKQRIRMRKKSKLILALIAFNIIVALAIYHHFNSTKTKHKLAVVIPFRDRFDELMVMVPHLSRYLQSSRINFEIIVVNQVDQWRFNRAALLNVGFHLTNIKSDFDYIILHDVDLLPMSYQLNYAYPEDGPYHISSPDLHPIYKFSSYLGELNLPGIDCSIFDSHLLYFNNNIPQFYTAHIHRAYNIKNKNSAFRHIHDNNRRPRDMKEFYNQRQAKYQRDRVTGLSTLRYRLVSQHQLTVDSAKCRVYNVQLECNLAVTPWCQNKKKKNRNRKVANSTKAKSPKKSLLFAKTNLSV
ncbi:uncharacterized protein TRIADDRAFT_61457 [Trichoplax adhaerens]|uniref:Beta-1,4-galactosyltransferase n=1 Tax=Trichoplax adhaerens TaxID=10228 RepID=B3SB15_TRIAD|nr:hypothetical protein TRIADDRAFT_61457 [Trichoplax adhaerens]EDV20030.1 hypothetical protein TRIADDRAFT_61457 [Trichoplax adhaerens]|eukprot:XP_002117414.1 hypothetical protein TRIADDRAFT_61457 [Trichoplax adhaerens]